MKKALIALVGISFVLIVPSAFGLGIVIGRGDFSPMKTLESVFSRVANSASVATSENTRPISAKKPLDWTPEDQEPNFVQQSLPLLDLPNSVYVRGAFLTSLREDNWAAYFDPLWMNMNIKNDETRLIGWWYYEALKASYAGKPITGPRDFYRDLFEKLKSKSSVSWTKFSIRETLENPVTQWDKKSSAYSYLIDPANVDTVWLLLKLADHRTGFYVNYIEVDFDKELAKYYYELASKPTMTWPEYLLGRYGKLEQFKAPK